MVAQSATYFAATYDAASFDINISGTQYKDVKLEWKGGPVLSHVEVVPIYYGKLKYANEIYGYYQGIVNSTYMDWLSEYKTDKGTIGRGTVQTPIVVTDGLKNSLTDSDIQQLFEALIAKKLISPNENTYYPIHLSEGIELGGMCTEWCAYHTNFATANGIQVYFGVVPDQSGKCTSGCGTGNAWENLCALASHELIEAVTDPDSENNGWFDLKQGSCGEIGDVCNQQTGVVVGGDGKSYTVQKQWSNVQNACRV
ncbi:hypothetical protein HDV01_000267 [Terramyces sp. JEL0728]|nr:hypothetical protein HDV01_000267 [Terramyces sp. JEL0728]